MTINLDTSVLLAYYQARTGATSTGSGASGTTSTSAQVPTAPWATTTSSGAKTGGQATSTTSATPTYASVNALVQSLTSGAKLINPGAAKLSVSTSNAQANSDYQNLFALYKGLTSLQSLAGAAGSTATTPADLSQLQTAFAAGLNQVQSFLTSDPFKQFQVGDGTVTTSDRSTVGAPEETDNYVTGLTTSSADADIPALQGDVQFAAQVATLGGSTTTVNFNLADMGATPRTLNNVVGYLNGQLQAAGVKTRFGEDVVSAGATATPATKGQPATVATAPQIALEVKDSPLETLTFSAPSSSAAVYVSATSTAPASAVVTAKTPAATPATTSQLLALNPAGQNGDTGGKIWTDNLPAGAVVQSSATASDGSIYVLADVGSTINGQTLQGSQDAALLKYDSAGDLVYTRTLGAASSASGYSLAVSGDGTEVAIAGSVAGALNPTTTAAAASTTPQSFVSVYDAASGDELWNANPQAGTANQANAVAFGADNSVYVAGQTSGGLPDAASIGGQDAYLQQFSAAQVATPGTGVPSWQVTSAFTQTFGTTGTDKATGVAVSGGTVYVSSVENGDGVVRAYDASAPGAPALVARQDLGALQGGNLSAIAVNTNGSVVVAGSTRNGALAAGTVTSAYTGGENAFVAQLSSNLDPAVGEALTYVSNGQDTTAAALTLSGDLAYIAGQNATGQGAATGAVSQTGYAAEIDPATGRIGWEQSFQGVNGNSAPTAIAVGAEGQSALDAIGLPQGEIDFSRSNTLIANTSLRVGDQFSIKVGAATPAVVTIAAGDTYSSLAQKIEKASGYRVQATTTTDAKGAQQIKIAPQTAQTKTEVAIEAGPTGRNALAGLGLQAGLITNASPVALASKSETSKVKGAYTVNVPTTLNLSTPAGVAAAQSQLKTAVAEVQTIYTDLTAKSSTATASGSSADAALINYYKTQNADEVSALQRLTAGDTTTTATTGTSSLGSLLASII